MNLPILIPLIFLACSSPKKEEAPIERAASTLADEQDNTTYLTEVSFLVGSATIDSIDQKKISSLIKQAKSFGEIDTVKLVTWADRGYPRKDEKVSKDQISLADRRNKNMKNYIKSLDKKLSVDTYNMTERPNAIDRLMNTDNLKIKRSLERAGITEVDGVINSPAKERKAIVMVILK